MECILVLGVFRAPASGVYLLTLYGLTVGPMLGPMNIKRNDEILCIAEIGDQATWNAASCTAIAELTPGDSVRVTGDSDRPITISAGSSGFAGHLIQEYL